MQQHLQVRATQQSVVLTIDSRTDKNYRIRRDFCTFLHIVTVGPSVLLYLAAPPYKCLLILFVELTFARFERMLLAKPLLRVH